MLKFKQNAKIYIDTSGLLVVLFKRKQTACETGRSVSMKLDRVKLIAEMARNGVSCNELVKRSGLSRLTVTNVRNGKSCTKSTAIAIARAIGVDISKITEEVDSA